VGDTTARNHPVGCEQQEASAAAACAGFIRSGHGLGDHNAMLHVFVGSSTEGVPIARQVAASLEGTARVNFWADGMFKVDRIPLDVLEEQVLKNDLAVLVASTDDSITVRGAEGWAMRDNVLFEFGLFSGRFGRHRTHLLLPDVPTFRVPSDILGVACIRYAHSVTDPTPAEVPKSVCSAVIEWAQAGGMEALQRKPGARLLKFISWVKEQAFDLREQPYPFSSTSAEFVVHGASAFVLDEVEALGVRKSFDQLVDALVDAFRAFPAHAVPDWLTLANDIDDNAPMYAEYRPDTVVRPVLFTELQMTDGSDSCLREMLRPWLARRSLFVRKAGIHHLSRLVRFSSNAETVVAGGLWCWWWLGICETLTTLNGTRMELTIWWKEYVAEVRVRVRAFEEELHQRVFG
jgi:hypothetical protein